MSLILTLFFAGFALIAAEIVLPGMVAGAMGFICLVIATVQAFSEWGMAVGFYIIVGEVILFTIGTALWIRYFPDSPFGRMVSLSKTAPPQQSFSKSHQHLLGKTGEALTSLHPSGIAKIEGERVDVVTEGSLINKGTTVNVVKVEGSRIVVRGTCETLSPT